MRSRGPASRIPIDERERFDDLAAPLRRYRVQLLEDGRVEALWTRVVTGTIEMRRGSTRADA